MGLEPEDLIDPAYYNGSQLAFFHRLFGRTVETQFLPGDAVRYSLARDARLTPQEFGAFARAQLCRSRAEWNGRVSCPPDNPCTHCLSLR